MSICGLPKELNEKIHRNFDAYTHRNMAMTCTYWNGVCVEIETDDKDLWRRFLSDYFPHYEIRNGTPFKTQFMSQFEIIASYPKALAAAFGGRRALAKFPTQIYFKMTAPVMRTHKHYPTYRKDLIGLAVRIKDLETGKHDTIYVVENENGLIAYSATELGANALAENPNYPVDINATAQKIENMLNKTDPRFVIE